MAQECPHGKCDGSGFITDEVARKSRDCSCRAQRVHRAKLRHVASGIPRRYRNVHFDRHPIAGLDRQVLNAARDYTTHIGDRIQEGRGLWLVGPTGTGKTSLAMLVARAALEQGHRAGIYTVPWLLSEIRDTYASSSDLSYSNFMRGLFEVDLLLLDDLGAERASDWVLEQLYVIINERWKEERSLIITSNISDDDQLRRLLGDRTLSRLYGICGDPLHLAGSDVRLRAVD